MTAAAPAASPHVSPARAWLLAARPKTLPAAVVPVIVGSAVALGDGAFQWGAAVACFVFRRLSACALPRASASASAKLANSRVATSHRSSTTRYRLGCSTV